MGASEISRSFPPPKCVREGPGPGRGPSLGPPPKTHGPSLPGLGLTLSLHDTPSMSLALPLAEDCVGVD